MTEAEAEAVLRDPLSPCCLEQAAVMLLVRKQRKPVYDVSLPDPPLPDVDDEE